MKPLVFLFCVIAVPLVTSCDKEKRIADGRIYVTQLDCLLKPVNDKNHSHIKTTKATHYLQDAVKLRSDLDAMPSQYRPQIGDTIESLAAHERAIPAPKGTEFRVVNRIEFEQALVGTWYFYECVHIKSGIRVHYTVPVRGTDETSLLEPK